MQYCPRSKKGRNLSAKRTPTKRSSNQETGIKVQPNERRCARTRETHILPLAACCPMSNNPTIGSEIEIAYSPADSILEVQSLREYIDSYIGGRGAIRSMEGMIQQITQDCADALKTMVHVRANLNINPNQRMILECAAHATNED